MKNRIRPYHLFLLLVGSASLLVLWRINKLSFYHHYFKVIEEVEMRNSQEVESLPQLVVFHLPTVAATQLPTQLLLWGLILLSIFLVFPVIQSASIPDLQIQLPNSQKAHPQLTRAP